MPSKIIPHLYVGNKKDSADIKFLYANNISLIVNCTKDLPFMTLIPSYRVAVNDDLSMQANIDMAHQIEDAADLISSYIDRGKNVLVHCFAGMQRSCAVIAKYLIKHRQMSPEDAIELIRTNRIIAFRPFINFKTCIH